MSRLQYQGALIVEKNIILTGFMGTGKSSVGKEISIIRNMGFIDTDDEIQKQYGPINDIFERHGEQYFRKCENEVVLNLAQFSGIVIATGGGLVLNPKNVEALQKSGIFFCLTAPPNEIFKRLTAKEETKIRPLLNTPDPLTTITEMLKSRRNIYDTFIQIDTVEKTPEDIAKEIDHFVKEML